MSEEPKGSVGSGGDPLGAMYFLAAVLMGAAFLAIVVLMFIPRDFLSRSDSENLFIPAASVPAAPLDSISELEAAAAALEAEEMHTH